MAEHFAINVDFARVKQDSGATILLAWGDSVQVVSTTASEFTVEVPDWLEQPDGSFKRVTSTGKLKRKIRVDGQDREVALPADQVEVLKLSFVDVQQGDGTLIQTPKGRLITLDAGMNQLFARFLASRYPGTSKTQRQKIDAMIVSHGDADHFAGLAQIQRSETEQAAGQGEAAVRASRAGVPQRARAARRPRTRELRRPTQQVGEDVIVTELANDILAVPATSMNDTVQGLAQGAGGLVDDRRPIAFRRLAKGDTTAFDFLADEPIEVEVLGPIETPVNGQAGLKFLPQPKDGVPLDHLDFQPGRLSDSHTINGHSIVLRLRYGNVRMLFAGDLNNAAEEQLVKEHKRKKLDLRAEVFKTPITAPASSRRRS